MAVMVVGVDASESSKHAVEFAADPAHRAGAQLLVVHVIPWSPYSFNTPGENEQRPERKRAELAAATEQIVQPAVALASAIAPDLSVDSIVQHGDPVDQLIELAAEHGAAGIVVGRTGDSRLRRAIFGSIPAHLVQVSPVPVTVVP